MENLDKDSCLFCKIIAGTLPASMVYQDDVCSAFLDIQPVNPGHVLVIPNQHAPYLEDISEKDAGHIFAVGKRIAAAIRRSSIKCEGINFFLADGEAAMQEVFHAHLHIFPRFAGDGFGLKFGEHYFTKPQRQELQQTADLIKKALQKHL